MPPRPWNNVGEMNNQGRYNDRNNLCSLTRGASSMCVMYKFCLHGVSFTKINGTIHLFAFPTGCPSHIPSSRRVLHAESTLEDKGVDGKTFHAYSMPTIKASLNRKGNE